MEFKMYSIGEFAKLLNVTQQTLRNWDKSGKLIPIKVKSGHRRYTSEHLNIINNTNETVRLNVVYCRESTKQQKSSLIEQEIKLKSFCTSNGIKIDKVISEYGSALNYKRKPNTVFEGDVSLSFLKLCKRFTFLNRIKYNEKIRTSTTY